MGLDKQSPLIVNTPARQLLIATNRNKNQCQKICVSSFADHDDSGLKPLYLRRPSSQCSIHQLIRLDFRLYTPIKCNPNTRAFDR